MNNILILFLPMLHPPDPIITFILFESRPLPVWAGLSALRKSLAREKKSNFWSDRNVSIPKFIVIIF